MSARDLAGAARDVLQVAARTNVLHDEVRALDVLQAALDRWDAAGNPGRLEHAEQRLHYLETLRAFLDASAGIEIGAFANDELAGRAIALRSALSAHVDEVTAVWDADRGLDD